MQIGVRILGSGGYLPGEEITNDDLIQQFNLKTTSEWINTNLGIQSRHFAPEGLATSDLAANASKIALSNSSTHATDLDRIILCTTSPDYQSPAAACNLQSLLGATCPAEDKQTACASFLFGLDHAIRLIQTGCQRVLVVGAEVKSRFVAKEDFRFKPIFADGAGAFVVGPCNEGEGFLNIELWTDGTKAKNLFTPAGGSVLPASHETVEKDLHTVQLGVDGRQIFDDAIEAMVRLSNQSLRSANKSAQDIDIFIPHQANGKIMNIVASQVGISPEKVISTIGWTANTVSATIPYALDFAQREGKLQPGKLILMVTAGAGYSGAASLYQVPQGA